MTQLVHLGEWPCASCPLPRGPPGCPPTEPPLPLVHGDPTGAGGEERASAPSPGPLLPVSARHPLTSPAGPPAGVPKGPHGERLLNPVARGTAVCTPGPGGRQDHGGWPRAALERLGGKCNPPLPTRMAAAQGRCSQGHCYRVSLLTRPSCRDVQQDDEDTLKGAFPGPPRLRALSAPGRTQGKRVWGTPSPSPLRPRTTGRWGGLCLFRAGPALQPPRWLHGTTLPPTGDEESVALTGPDQGASLLGDSEATRGPRRSSRSMGEQGGGEGSGSRFVLESGVRLWRRRFQGGSTLSLE